MPVAPTLKATEFGRAVYPEVYKWLRTWSLYGDTLELRDVSPSESVSTEFGEAVYEAARKYFEEELSDEKEEC